MVSCDSPVGKLGVTVCYDVRFPELYQKLRFQHGVDRNFSVLRLGGGVLTKMDPTRLGPKKPVYK